MRIRNPFRTPQAILGVSDGDWNSAKAAITAYMQTRPGQEFIDTKELVPLHPVLARPEVLNAMLATMELPFI